MSSGWNVHSDYLDEHIFYFVLNGGIDATVDGQCVSLQAGDAAITPPGSKFAFRATDDAAIELYRFRLTISPSGKTVPVLDRFHHAFAPGCRDYFARLISEGEFPTKGGEWKTKGLLLALLSEAFFPTQRTTTERVLVASEIRQLRSYIHQRSHHWPSPADLARELKLSADYFSRIFRRTMGMPPRRWIVEERVRMAALALVESNQNVSEVAEAFGYCDVYFFSQQFKKVTGLSPSHYARNQRNAAR